MLEKKSNKLGGDVESGISFLETRGGFELVRLGHYAFHCDAQTAFPIIFEKFDPHEICDLNLLLFRPGMFISFVAKRESPFRSIFATK